MHKYNIVIVEDEFINAHFIEKAILKLGHRLIATVECSEAAVEVIKEKNVDIVFMDINLEGAVDGIACAKLINKHKNIPIIYTTAFSDSETIDLATDTNSYSYLIKPFDYKDIETALAITIKQAYIKSKQIKNTNTKSFTELGKAYRYYEKTKTLKREERTVKLTKNESEIFYQLFKSLNQIVSIEYLENNVWYGKSVSASTRRDTILRLRKKIPDLTINTVSGVGYALEYS